MTAEINVQHIGKTFNDFTALEDVSFSVQKGEIFGFLGPSGSGKTTLIKILTAQLDQTKGKASVFGIPVNEMKRVENKSRFGILTDNSGLYKRLSVEENLMLYKDLYELNDSAIDEALAFVNLQDARKKKVSRLSKGMLQRVTLARALMHKPDLLFLDEPTSALDPGNTHHIYKGLRKLNEMGTTIFLTTHDMAEAETLCDRVAFLHEGKIKAIGAPSDLRLRHSDQSMIVELTNGEQYTLPLNELTTAGRLEEWMRHQLIQRIWSNEPTLGDIFMEMTGRDLR
ncbi:ABC transporter ATP-binding protein [Jeotgalibacillus malaysiensis]|uniref:ABC transporter ATP-binding protein n=1 Tax=Jeotgalibacillus malaysiensis TaxID=1508404 RepID=UPI00384ACC29